MGKPLLLFRAVVLLTYAVCALSLALCPPCGPTPVPYPLSIAPTCGDPSYRIRCAAAAGTLLFDSSNNTYPITSISPSNQRLTVAPSSFFPNTCVAADLPTNGLQLDPSAPFNITSGNTIFYLNCSASILNSPLNCTADSLCHVYVNATAQAGACRAAPCCAFRAGGSTTSYRIRVRQSGCRAYRSFVNLDPELPVGRWPQPGVELQWVSPPEPTCRGQGDCGSDSSCRPDPNSTRGVSRCFCHSGLRWDPVAGVCARECQDPNGCDKDRTAVIAGLPQNEEEEPRRSKRTKVIKSFDPDFLTYVLENGPRIIQEALSGPYAPLWKEDINSEIECITVIGSWLISHQAANEYKWIFKMKYKVGESIEKYNARLIVKGFK